MNEKERPHQTQEPLKRERKKAEIQLELAIAIDRVVARSLSSVYASACAFGVDFCSFDPEVPEFARRRRT